MKTYRWVAAVQCYWKGLLHPARWRCIKIHRLSRVVSVRCYRKEICGIFITSCSLAASTPAASARLRRIRRPTAPSSSIARSKTCSSVSRLRRRKERRCFRPRLQRRKERRCVRGCRTQPAEAAD